MSERKPWIKINETHVEVKASRNKLQDRLMDDDGVADDDTKRSSNLTRIEALRWWKKLMIRAKA